MNDQDKAARAEAWRRGKVPVSQLSRNPAERRKQWLEGKCGSWCLDKQLFRSLLRLGAIDEDGFITERAF